MSAAEQVPMERLERAQRLGLVQLLAAVDVRTAWRSVANSSGQHGTFTLRERFTDRYGRSWPGGVVELEYAGRPVLVVGFQDPGQNQAMLIGYLPDGVVAAWEREFVSHAWDAIADAKVAAYEESVAFIGVLLPVSDPWGRPEQTPAPVPADDPPPF